MMTDAELNEVLNAFRANHGHILDGEHAVRHPPMSMERLKEIEGRMGVIFPHQYKRHLSRHGSGDFAFSRVYSPDPTVEWALWNEYEYMPANLGKFLTFADNGGGDYYGFRIVNGECMEPVCWADHESGYAISEPQYPDFNTFIAEIALRIKL